MKRIALFAVVIALSSGCGTPTYKKADPPAWYGNRKGSLDMKLEEGTYILEYSHIGGYDYDLELNKQFWERRATELCPNGYYGGFEVIHPAYAKIEEFVCPQVFCTSYPLVSGIIKCK